MRKSILSLVIVPICIMSCNTSNNIYKSEKTKGVDYAQYKTYAWLPTKDTAYTRIVDKKIVERSLASAVIAQLSERGMVRDTVNPDCLFTYTLVMNKTYTVGQTPPEVYNRTPYVTPVSPDVYYFTPDYGPSSYSGHMSVSTFRDGTLVIDMIDKKDHKIIWRSSASGKTAEEDRKGPRATIKEIVPEMFSKFPKKKVN